VCPVGSCRWPGADDPTSQGLPQAEAGDTPRYLGPNGPWMPLRLWSYLCSLSWAVGMVGLSRAPARRFAAMVGQEKPKCTILYVYMYNMYDIHVAVSILFI